MLKVQNQIPKIVHIDDLSDYLKTLRSMQEFTAQRQVNTRDEIWCLQHLAVFSQGVAGKKKHILVDGDIPVIQSDRGGQVTYHGPGQLVVYLMLDIGRLGIGPKSLVVLIEDAIIALLATLNIKATTREKAPGVYINQTKIASLGLRIQRRNCYHGLALNINMDMEPFNRINICGMSNIKAAQISDFIPDISFIEVENKLVEILLLKLAELKKLKDSKT